MSPIFAVIDNSGPNTLTSYLRSASKGCEKIDLAAFATQKGLDSVMFALERVARRGRVRVLTGLYQGFTEPKALRALLRAQAKHSDRFSVHLSTETRFHWKSYFVFRRSTCTVVSGSSNLTQEGLASSGEFNLAMTLSKQAKSFQEIHGAFEKNWIAKSRPLTQEILERYESWRSNADVGKTRTSVPLARILGRANQSTQRQEQLSTRYWRTWVDCDLSDDSMSLLEETTDWERRGFDIFSELRATFRRGDRVLLFDLAANEISVVAIKDTTKTPVLTEDGRYFAAHLPVRGLSIRKITKRRWESLKSEGLMKRKADMATTRKLSQARFEKFVENLKGQA